MFKLFKKTQQAEAQSAIKAAEQAAIEEEIKETWWDAGIDPNTTDDEKEALKASGEVVENKIYDIAKAAAGEGKEVAHAWLEGSQIHYTLKGEQGGDGWWAANKRIDLSSTERAAYEDYLAIKSIESLEAYLTK